MGIGDETVRAQSIRGRGSVGAPIDDRPHRRRSSHLDHRPTSIPFGTHRIAHGHPPRDRPWVERA